MTITIIKMEKSYYLTGWNLVSPTIPYKNYKIYKDFTYNADVILGIIDAVGILDINNIILKHCSDNIYDDSKHKLLINSDIEKFINERPADYSWEYKRFKRSEGFINNPYEGL